MIGLDIARIRRWVYKVYPTLTGVNSRVEVVTFTVSAVDLDGGIDATFVARLYDLSSEEVAITFSGQYHRMHYGGWTVTNVTNTINNDYDGNLFSDEDVNEISGSETENSETGSSESNGESGSGESSGESGSNESEGATEGGEESGSNAENGGGE